MQTGKKTIPEPLLPYAYTVDINSTFVTAKHVFARSDFESFR